MLAIVIGVILGLIILVLLLIGTFLTFEWLVIKGIKFINDRYFKDVL